MNENFLTSKRSISSAFSLGIAAIIIAIVLGGSALGITLTTSHGGSNNSLSSEYSQLSTNYASLSSQYSSLSSSVANQASVNQPPGVVAFKLQWCLQTVVQDRFCPQTLTVNQGDIVQVLFIQNDTAVHTFTLDTAPYNFQINDSGAGYLDFLNNYAPLPGGCVNTGTFAEMSAGISGTYCVSGTSLLSSAQLTSQGANNFYVAQNPFPGYPITPGSQTVSGTPPSANAVNPSVVLLPVNDQATVNYLNVTGVGVGAVCGATCGSWGIGAFQATAPGIYEFFCHYHVSNGMYGYMIVLPNAYCNTHASACNIAGS